MEIEGGRLPWGYEKLETLLNNNLTLFSCSSKPVYGLSKFNIPTCNYTPVSVSGELRVGFNL